MIDLADLSNIAGRDVSRETLATLIELSNLVENENNQQNLISATTVGDLWKRHIVDSLQLLRFSHDGCWIDLGTGAGFPGLVIAVLHPGPVVLVEERRLRHEFLSNAVLSLGLTNVQVIGSRVESVPPLQAAVISARAFAPLAKILALSHRFATPTTRWVLPKGKKAQEELASIRSTWQGDFRLETSVTDPTSSIIVAENVSPRGRR